MMLMGLTRNGTIGFSATGGAGQSRAERTRRNGFFDTRQRIRQCVCNDAPAQEFASARVPISALAAHHLRRH
jgi:hypothetical protein